MRPNSQNTWKPEIILSTIDYNTKYILLFLMYMKILKQKEEVDRQKLRAYGLDLFSLKFKKKMQKVS